MNIVGKTPDDKFVLSGVYDFHSTHGLPLDMLFETLYQNGYIPSWIHFFSEADKNGANFKRLRNKLHLPVVDIYGKDIWRIVDRCLSMI